MEKEVIVKWKIKETETSRILALLPALVEKTRAEEGNLFYNIYQSVDDINILILHERYADDFAAEAHRNSTHYIEIVAQQIVPSLEVREVSSLKKLY